jgi:hypothetical protein
MSRGWFLYIQGRSDYDPANRANYVYNGIVCDCSGVGRPGCAYAYYTPGTPQVGNLSKPFFI